MSIDWSKFDPNRPMDLFTGGTEARGKAQAKVDQGLSNTGSTAIGGIPDYAAMMQSIQQAHDQQISLPVDMQVAINNAAQSQLGANQAQKMITGGGVAQAANQLAGDAMANAAIKTKSAARLDEAVGNNMNKANEMAMGEAKDNGARALSNLGDVDLSNLKALHMQAQADHANAGFKNTTDAMADDLSFANQQGIQKVKGAAQASQDALNSATIAQDVVAWGQAMQVARATGGAASAGVSAAAHNSGNEYDTDPKFADASSDYTDSDGDTWNGDAAWDEGD